MLRRRQGRFTDYFVRTRFRWQGRDAVLYNLHMRSFGSRKPWKDDVALLRPATLVSYLQQFRQAYMDRAWEAEQLHAMMREEELPMLVVGDFNSTPHSWVYRRMSDGMQDAFLTAGRGWGATYHTHLPVTRIDFILASPEWEVVSAHVPAVALSDHRPVVARLRWRGEAEEP